MDWLFHLGHWHPILAQTTAGELELLKAQYVSLESTFQRYVSMVQLTLATAWGIVGCFSAPSKKFSGDGGLGEEERQFFTAS